MKKQYRLGLDLGANSIGWCAVELTGGVPSGLLDMGVRIYPDGRNPKDKTSLAAARRQPRAMRRNRDRYLRRRRNLLNALTRFGLMPEDQAGRSAVASIDPYALRAKALHERLSPHELGRVLFHLNQHRGFQSNRKLDRASNESGLIKTAADETHAALISSGHLTIGSWLAERHVEKKGVRVRLAGAGKTASYPFYPLRSMIESEFDTIWSAQAGWDPTLTDDKREQLKRIIFHQRPLKPVKVGKCWLEPSETRAPRALPSTQRFRIAQALAHLRLSRPGQPDVPLSDTQRAALSAELYRGKDLTLDQVRTRLKLDPETDFNTREDKLLGCATAARLGNGKKAAIGPAWHAIDLTGQDQAVSAILDAETDEEAMSALLALGIAPEAAERAQKTPLPDGHGSLSSVAIRKILPFLEAGQRYSDAVQAAGYDHHSDRRTGEIRERLPYYGEILAERIGTGTGEPQDPDETRLGRAPNPTVHVALNELRRVVNAIIDHHGTPAEIVVETLRDLGRSKKQREAYEAEQKKNRDANERRDGMLRECGMPVNSRNRMRVRLWEEQAFDAKNRVCPYTGTLITLRTALSDAIEEDHILPFAVSLDDSAANRMLVTREANRTKARRTPHEAFGASAEWPAILERAALLPQNKRWRFQPDALSRLAENGDFLARHLTDSATIALWAKDYLEVLAPGKVRSVPGRLTALLRPALGLTPAAIFGHGGNKKDRNDHRHHVLDAVVVSLTDQGLLQRVTLAAKRAEAAIRRLLMEMEAPWEGFTADIARRAGSLVVSHKPDIGWQAALHNDTAYGEIRGAGKGEDNVVVRRPVDTIIKDDGTLKFSVRDPVLAARIEAAAASGTDAQSRKAALRNIMYSGHMVRTVRATERLDAKQTISDRQTKQPYKVVKTDGNHRAELWRLPDGKLKLIVVSVFDAARQVLMARLGGKVPDTRPHPAAKLVLRLQKNDMILFGPDNNRQPLRVVKFSDGNVTFAPHSEGGNLKARDGAKDDPFKYIYCSASRLIAEGAQKIFVTPDGRVWPADRRK